MIGLREQGASVSACFPHFRVSYRADEMTARGEVRPTERSVQYRLRITYRVGDKPCVYVVSPKLDSLDPMRKIPHVYPDHRLCLYRPLSPGAWTKARTIGETIIPWAIEWLFHYEIWQLTGEWRGGGEEPSGIKSESEYPDFERDDKHRTADSPVED